MQVEEAVMHFLKADCEAKAVEACLKAGLWGKARQILKNRKDPAASEKLFKIATHLEQNGDLSEAEEAYVEVIHSRVICHSLYSNRPGSLQEFIRAKLILPATLQANAIDKAVKMRYERGQLDAALKASRRSDQSTW